MNYVIPFMDDLEADEEAMVAETRELLANDRYVGNQQVLLVIERLYETVEGLRQHNEELEEELKGVYRNEL